MMQPVQQMQPGTWNFVFLPFKDGHDRNMYKAGVLLASFWSRILRTGFLYRVPQRPKTTKSQTLTLKG